MFTHYSLACTIPPGVVNAEGPQLPKTLPKHLLWASLKRSTDDHAYRALSPLENGFRRGERTRRLYITRTEITKCWKCGQMRPEYIISDGIVVWRAWIMFPESRPVRLTLLFCMVGSLVAGFVDAGLVAAQAIKRLEGDTIPKINILILALPLLFTNMIATLLIGYKTWYHYQDLKKNLSNSGTSSSRVQKVLLLLVESGSVYCIFWYGENTVSDIWGAAVPELSALYPVLIVVIAAAENAKPATIDEMSLSQSIRFASGQASSFEGHMSMTESQSNAPGTTTLLEAEAAEHTGGNLT
ncbi:hypothetical protein K435DRAFT_868926 [Dendrothele bispora CBS 962.96]|uniref:Uncharacterized protein n=1 Tax=Dendrothele bispora (strain CBS 962.96) TaxID=1314807 RepID=A0A4S8LAL2_DENBC|nr:hypothetical protein K435DRAFT_868926 [Dendrothele bispora CBS 962.96]